MKQSFLSTASSIARDQGLAGFYRGLFAYVILCGRPAIQNTIYGQIRLALIRARSSRRSVGEKISALESFVIGAFARALATLIVYPFIRAKVLAQAARGALDGEPKQPGMLWAMRAAVSAEGVSSLYRGIAPELVRGTLSSAIMLMIKEQSQSLSRAGLALVMNVGGAGKELP